MNISDTYLARCIQIAAESLAKNGFPVGAIIVKDEIEIASGISCTELHRDVTAHAEIQAIRASGAGAEGSTLYSSLEPCMMCVAGCSWAGVRRVVFACSRSVVRPEYYETGSSCAELSRLLHAPLEIVPSLGRQSEVVALIKEWELLHSKTIGKGVRGPA